MKWTKEKVAKKLSEIQASVPANLKRNVISETKKTPTVEFVMREALKSKDIPEEKKRQIQTLLDAGEFSKTKKTEDPRIAKMIDNYVGRKINEAIRNGQLPPKGTKIYDS